MAFVQNPDDEEEKNQGQPQPIAGTDQLGVGSSGPSAAGPTAGSFSSPQAAGLSGFTDVGAYLDANKDQAQDLAGKVATKFGQQATQARSDIDAANQTFQSAVGQSSVSPDADLVGRAASDPASFVTNPQDLARFMQMRNAQYTGPTQFETTPDYAKLQGEVGSALANKGNIDTEQGRQQLLYGLGSNPTAGQVTFDQLLLGADPNARATLANAAAPFAGLSDYLNTTTQGADANAAQAKQNTGQAAQLVADTFTNPQSGVVPQFQQSLMDQYNAASQQRNDFNQEYSDIASRLSGPAMPGQPWGLTAQEYNDLKLNPQSLDQIGQAEQILSSNYNQPAPPAVNFWEGASQGIQTPTVQNVATPEEFARAQALQQLMGTSITGIDPSHPEQAGTYDPSRMNFGALNLDKANAATIQAVNQQDKQIVDSYIQNTYPQLANSTDRYAQLNNMILSDPALQLGGLQGGQVLYSALQRLINGFNAPNQQFTPVTTQPSLGGGVTGTAPPPTTQSGGRATR